MKRDKANGADANKGAKVTELAVGIGSAGVGGLFGLYPQLAPYGVAIQIMAPLMQMAAGRLHVFLNEVQARRVEGVADDVRARLEEAGLADKFEDIRDIMSSAAPIIGDAETDHKRRMITEVIVNSARRDGAMAEAQALRAMRLIGSMLPEVALVFSVVAVEHRKPNPARIQKSSMHPDTVIQVALPFVRGQSCDAEGRLPYAVVEPAEEDLWKLGLIHRYGTESGKGGGFALMNLSHTGRWLADWIEKNPPIDRQPVDDDETDE